MITLFYRNLIRSLTKRNPLAMALASLLVAGNLLGETVAFSGLTKKHDVLLLLNPPSAQIFVYDLSEEIHDYVLTFDGTNLYYLHDTWKSLEAKTKSLEQDQFAIVQYEPLLQNGSYLL